MSQSQDVWLIDSTRGDARRLTRTQDSTTWACGRPTAATSCMARPGSRWHEHVRQGSRWQREGSAAVRVRRACAATDNRLVEQRMVFARRDAKTLWDMWTMPYGRAPGATGALAGAVFCKPHATSTTECSLRMADGWRTPPISRDDGKCTLGRSRNMVREGANLDQRRQSAPSGGATARSCSIASADRTISWRSATASTARVSAQARPSRFVQDAHGSAGLAGSELVLRRRARTGSASSSTVTREVADTSPVSVFTQLARGRFSTKRGRLRNASAATDFRNPLARQRPRIAP